MSTKGRFKAAQRKGVKRDQDAAQQIPERGKEKYGI